MTQPISTDLSLLETFNVDFDTIFKPYDYVIAHQNDACELNREQTIELMKLTEAMPTVRRVTMSSTGLRLHYASRANADSYLYVEIDQVSEDRFFCTTFVDDFDYFIGYMPQDD